MLSSDALSVYFSLMILQQPFFHFLEQLYFTGIPRWIGKSCNGSLGIKFFIFKPAVEFGIFGVQHEPAVLIFIFYI